MKRKYISLILVIAGFSGLVACSNGNNNQKNASADPPPVPVSVYKVEEENVKGIDAYPATVVPLNETELRAQVTGYLTGVLVKDGQVVSKGQRLYEIDRVRYEAALNQAKANLNIALSNYAKVSKDVERYTTLLKQDAIAKQTVDYAVTDQANAKAQVEAARAAVSSAANDLQHAVITAPFSGSIGIAQVKSGALVTAGSTLINTISSTDPIAADIPVKEQDIAKFVRLQTRGTAAKDSVFTLQLPDGTVYNQVGRITAVDRAVNPQTGTLTVRVSFPNPEKLLRAGMNTMVRVVNQDNGLRLTIPFKAVTENLGEFYVFVVEGNKVSQRPIKIGTRAASKVVVREGLKTGETIVTDGTQNLRDGSTVQVGEPTASKQANAQ